MAATARPPGYRSIYERRCFTCRHLAGLYVAGGALSCRLHGGATGTEMTCESWVHHLADGRVEAPQQGGYVARIAGDRPER